MNSTSAKAGHRIGSPRRAALAIIALLTLLAGTLVISVAGPYAQEAQAVKAVPAAGPENPDKQAPIQVNLGPDAQPLPKNMKFAWSFVLADANTGEILAAKDYDRKLPQASTLKVLTALTTMPHLDRHSIYYATKQDEEAEGMRAGVKAGGSYSLDDLFHGMLLPSGNDAASAIANANGGWGQTIEAMNAEAQRVGATNTVAKTPSGLDEPGQHSTAKDLVTIFRNAMQIPEFAHIMSVKRYEFPGPPLESEVGSDSNTAGSTGTSTAVTNETTDGTNEANGEGVDAGADSATNSDRNVRGTYPIWTSNRLLLNDHEGSIGGKTGFTSQAGRTFVAAAERNGRTLVLSMMRSARSTELLSEELLTWGFANADKVTPVGELPAVAPRVPTQALPALQLNADGTAKGDQQEVIENLAAVNQGKTMQSIAQAAGSEMGSSLLSALFRPVLWLATLALLVVAVLRLRVMVLAGSRGAPRTARVDHIDLRSSDRERISK